MMASLRAAVFGLLAVLTWTIMVAVSAQDIGDESFQMVVENRRHLERKEFENTIDASLASTRKKMGKKNKHGPNKDEAAADCQQITTIFNLTIVNQNTVFVPSGPIAPGTRQLGSFSIFDPVNTTVAIGTYEFMTTFLNSNLTDLGCIGVGSYTLGRSGQITFTASCKTLPFFSITGGYDDFQGAYGFVEFNIPIADGVRLHKINVCVPKIRAPSS